MKTETMSIHKGLANLKLIDKKVLDFENESFGTMFNSIQLEKNKAKVEATKARMKSKYQAWQDLLKRRAAIKSAIVLSNAVTEINIDGNKMTVAEAIDRKNNMEYEERLFGAVAKAINVDTRVESFNQGLVDQATEEVLRVLGGDKQKLQTETFNTMVKDLIAAKEKVFITGFNVYKEFDSMRDEIDLFKSNVDFLLSESNTITQITIEY